MTIFPPESAAIAAPPGSPPIGRMERVLRGLSVITLVMTVPQVLTIWVGHDAGGVSLVSWGTYLVSASLWLVHGIQRHDKTIYLACIGWIILDAAVVVGVLVHG